MAGSNHRGYRETLLLVTLLSFPLNALVEAFMLPPEIASQYSLSTSTSFPFPSATQSNSETQKTLVNRWSINKGRIQQGTNNVAFVPDPFPNYQLPSSSSPPSPSGPVLQVTYAKGGSSSSGSGIQFYSLWNSTSDAFRTALLTYEVAFDSTFDWVKGGKLPGLRGGPDPNACDGGSTCNPRYLVPVPELTSLAYAYILTPNNLCSDQRVRCNEDFGISLDRGAFTFQAGQWNRINLLVQLNSDPHIANGQIQVFYNDVLAITQQNLQFRRTSDLTVGGMFFSTFYGGSDASWAPSNTTHAYFRNVQLWGGSSASNLTGQRVNGASAISSPSPLLAGLILLMMYFLRWLA